MDYRDTVEFYEGDNKNPFLTVPSSFAPNDGDVISIGDQNLVVIARSYSVDYPGDRTQKRMRCNVIVKVMK